MAHRRLHTPRSICRKHHLKTTGLRRGKPHPTSNAGGFWRSRVRLLVAGCGDVGLRFLQQRTAAQGKRILLIALTRNPEHQQQARLLGIRTICADLDEKDRYRRLGALGNWHLLLFPPNAQQSKRDPRSSRLVATRSRDFSRCCYLSTSGVYGDCLGQMCTENQKVNPSSDRAIRRATTEQFLRHCANSAATRLSIVRAPGIYAHNRLPLKQLQAGAPVLHRDDDVWTNHIHADDLANILWLALLRGRHNRTINACDDTQLRMGDYFDMVADTLQLPRPPRLPRWQLAQCTSQERYSFMRESRRLSNQRMKTELGVRLRYPTVQSTLLQTIEKSLIPGKHP